ncbi:MAG TPA: phage tail protein I [Sphingomonas sp.]|nr:phage tail protein I [Sphingomonas sp.]
MSLLPPNATKLERALEAGTARIGDIAAPIDTLVDPATIAAGALPWLAFGLSVDLWDAAWPEAVKRDAVATSIAQHRIKGTVASVEHVLARIDALARIVEWHDTAGRLAPHTFEIEIPLVTTPGAAGGVRAGAAIVDDIIAQVGTVKPLREHLTVVQSLAMEGGVGVQGAARLAGYTRDEGDLTYDPSTAWDFYLQTEDGEPLQAEAGGFLDTAP